MTDDGTKQIAIRPDLLRPRRAIPTLIVYDGDEIAAGTDPLNPLHYPGAPLPALGPWGIGVLVALLGAIGMRRSRRRAR